MPADRLSNAQRVRKYLSDVAAGGAFLTALFSAITSLANEPVVERMTVGVVHVLRKQPDPAPLTEIERPLGTGFVVSKTDRCLIATAKHLFIAAPRDRIVIRLVLDNRMTGRTTRATIVQEDPKRDLALLEANKDFCLSNNPHVFPLFASPLMETKMGDEIIVIGHPGLDKGIQDYPIARSGIIASTAFTMDRLPVIILDMQAIGGYSGSPVIVRNNGYAVGVVGGPIKKAAGFTVATPISNNDILNQLK